MNIIAISGIIIAPTNAQSLLWQSYSVTTRVHLTWLYPDGGFLEWLVCRQADKDIITSKASMS